MQVKCEADLPSEQVCVQVSFPAIGNLPDKLNALTFPRKQLDSETAGENGNVLKDLHPKDKALQNI